MVPSLDACTSPSQIGINTHHPEQLIDIIQLTMVTKLLLVHGGELAKDVAEQIAAKKPAGSSISDVTLRCASERPKTLLDVDAETIVCFVMQTIENSAPTEEVRIGRKKNCACFLSRHES